MANPTPRRSRRNFIRTLGAGSAAAAAAVVAVRPATESPPAQDAERAAAGYRESAHIRNYYRTAKV
jgi:hypothetical protein